MTSLIRPPFNAADRMISVRPDSGWAAAMTRLERLYTEQRQSPWLDNLTRPYLRDGTLAAFVADGIRGVTANPTILAKAIEGSDAYDAQFAVLTAQGSSLGDAYWELAVQDVTDALAVLRPTFDNSHGSDGFVSIEVAPELARDTEATIAAAARLHERIARPNLLVKVPATAEGIPAIAALIGQGLSINITLIFSLSRYAQVIDAYLEGLETFAARGGDLAAVRSVASFFVSRVDTEVDHRLEQIGGERRLGVARTCRSRPGAPGLPDFPEPIRRRAMGETRRPRRPCAAAIVGLDVDEEPRLPRHPLRRQSHRPRHHQHHGRGHHHRIRGPRHPRAHRRHGDRAGRTQSCTTYGRWGSTWMTSGTPLKTKASPASTSRSPICLSHWTPRHDGWRSNDRLCGDTAHNRRRGSALSVGSSTS